jgi:5-methylcytosine-specific restriction protein B
VFGELMYLLEYRDREIPLSVDGKLFKIPENVRIIGTMNTADHSIALVDHALRRRFAFIKLQPDYEVMKRYQIKENPTFPFNNLIQVLGDLNRAIKDPNYEIGIPYFLKPDLMNHLESIWKMEIEPYLEEYFFDNTKSVEQFRWERVKPTLGL